MIDDTEDARDYLDEAERIAAGTSHLLPERAHLDALIAALRSAREGGTRKQAELTTMLDEVADDAFENASHTMELSHGMIARKDATVAEVKELASLAPRLAQSLILMSKIVVKAMETGVATPTGREMGNGTSTVSENER